MSFFIGEKMVVLFHIGSMITSVIGLIMILTLTFAEEDSGIYKYYGEKEAIICVVLAFLLMILGYLVDRR